MVSAKSNFSDHENHKFSDHVNNIEKNKFKKK